jgi:hypothetical protein
MSHTFTIRATPVTHEQHDGYATTSFLLFSTPQYRDTITVDSPTGIPVALSEWAYSHDLPVLDNHGTEVHPNAWSVSVVKPSRWPAGYKQLGEQSHTFVLHAVPSEV